MLLYGIRLDYHVIDIHFYSFSYLFLTNLNHQWWVGYSDVLKAEKHYFITKICYFGQECRIFLILNIHGDFIISLVCIMEAQQLVLDGAIHKSVYATNG